MGAVKKFFGWLIGGGKTADKVIDSVSSGIDYSIYTRQEKAEDGQRRLTWMLEWLKFSAPQNVSRRRISIMVVALWIFLILLMVFARLIGRTEDAGFIFDTLRDLVNKPFMIIIGFYFVAHVVRAFKGDQKND